MVLHSSFLIRLVLLSPLIERSTWLMRARVIAFARSRRTEASRHLQAAAKGLPMGRERLLHSILHLHSRSALMAISTLPTAEPIAFAKSLPMGQSQLLPGMERQDMSMDQQPRLSSMDRSVWLSVAAVIFTSQTPTTM